MKKTLLVGAVLMFFTSFANKDTTKPERRTLLQKLFNVKAKGERLKADTRVSLIITQRLVDSTWVLIDSLKKQDSITKKE